MVDRGFQYYSRLSLINRASISISILLAIGTILSHRVKLKNRLAGGYLPSHNQGPFL
jgi:hypothetical protein